jgi:hypothetical protein
MAKRRKREQAGEGCHAPRVEVGPVAQRGREHERDGRLDLQDGAAEDGAGCDGHVLQAGAMVDECM